MKVVVVLVVLANCFGARASSRDYNLRFDDYFKPQEDSQCKQELPNCAKCLQKSSCTWCSDNQHSTGTCKSTQDCPSNRQLACQLSNPESNLENELGNLIQEDRSYVLDVKEVTLNASYLCQLQTNCSTCTTQAFCAWCKKKGACIAYSGASNTGHCGSNSWYRNQCTYSGFTTQCPDRKPNCKDCLSDGICQWCESTQTCGYYEGDGYIPANCSSDQWYYESCSHVKEIIVLFPIILLILVPVFAYVIMYCALSVMRHKGYGGLDDSDSSDDDDEDMKRRPIMLRHGSPGGETDKLRKKYDLGKKP